MIKDYANLSRIDKLELEWANVLTAVEKAYTMYYYFQLCESKKIDIKNLTKKGQLEMACVKVLKKLGYSLDECGTYLYAFTICEIVNRVREAFDLKRGINTDSLITQLQNSVSQFYYDVAKEDLEIGINKFHDYIEKSIDQIDVRNVDYRLVRMIYSDGIENLDYGVNAFLIARYLLGIKGYDPSRRTKPPIINKLDRKNSNLLSGILRKL